MPMKWFDKKCLINSGFTGGKLSGISVVRHRRLFISENALKTLGENIPLSSFYHAPFCILTTVLTATFIR